MRKIKMAQTSKDNKRDIGFNFVSFLNKASFLCLQLSEHPALPLPASYYINRSTILRPSVCNTYLIISKNKAYYIIYI